MATNEKANEISTLVDLLCGMLRQWSEDPQSVPIGDIDKAAATLKKLQDIHAAEQDRLDSGGQEHIIITHHIPRAEETDEEDEQP